MTCNQFDVVVVPFPFVDTPKAKPRPVLVISSDRFVQENDHCIAAMITSALHTPWYGDTAITDLEHAGLSKPSIIRLKLFTLDVRFEPRRIGQLSHADTKAFNAKFKTGMC